MSPQLRSRWYAISRALIIRLKLQHVKHWTSPAVIAGHSTEPRGWSWLWSNSYTPFLALPQFLTCYPKMFDDGTARIHGKDFERRMSHCPLRKAARAFQHISCSWPHQTARNCFRLSSYALTLSALLQSRPPVPKTLNWTTLNYHVFLVRWSA